MAKLPENSVKRPPMFDSPLRRTTSPKLAPVPDAPAGVGGPASDSPAETQAPAPAVARVEAAVPEPVGVKSTKATTTRSRKRKPQPEPGEVELSHRLTARLTAEQYEKIENECHRRRLSGDRQVSAAVLLREIVEHWKP